MAPHLHHCLDFSSGRKWCSLRCSFSFRKRWSQMEPHVACVGWSKTKKYCFLSWIISSEWLHWTSLVGVCSLPICNTPWLFCWHFSEPCWVLFKVCHYAALLEHMNSIVSVSLVEYCSKSMLFRLACLRFVLWTWPNTEQCWCLRYHPYIQLSFVSECQSVGHFLQ